MNSLVLIVVLAAFSVKLTVQSALTAADSFDADAFDADAFDAISYDAISFDADSFDADSLLNEADLDDAAEDEDFTRKSLSIGSISVADRTLASNHFFRSAISNQVQTQDKSYSFKAGTRISAIRVRRVGASQQATPKVISGGIGKNAVKIRITSAKGKGYNYAIDIYGK